VALVVLGFWEQALNVGHLKLSLTDIHIGLGFALTVGFILRVVWGLVGPTQARLKTLWLAVKSLAASRSEKDHEKFGYEDIASLAYAIFYLIVAWAVLSGLLLSGMRYDQGPFAAILFDELTWHGLVLALHKVSLYAATFFFFAHIIGMIRHEKKSGAPVAQSMISGYQYRMVKRKRGEF
jgi:Ni,Fe-hydrogenase I cytochrome b subunit